MRNAFIILAIFLCFSFAGKETSDGYFDTKKRRGKFYVAKIEAFKEFYILRLQRKNKLYKSVVPKSAANNCFRVEIGKQYYFVLFPTLDCPRNFMMHPVFENLDYYDVTVSMEKDPAYARNVYEIQNIKGVCAD